MSRVACSLLLLACILGLPLQGIADDGKPASVKDLEYGEVLFHFYKQDYFNSIVRLQIARKQQRLPHHEREAALLLGGLDLSYGLRNSANDIFTSLLNDASVDAAVHNRAWYHLARISYQRGDAERALHALEQIKGRVSESNRAEAMYLQSLLLLQQGRNTEAIRVMQDAGTDKDWSPYLKYNLGIARIRNNELEDGTRLLEKIGQTNAGNEELRLLRDKANLALGFSYLKDDSAIQSRQSLDRVRLAGPLSNKALLGAGWADASADAYSLALVPWMELGQRNTADPAVQEALLAIPYAMAKMSLHGRAVEHYNDAIEILLQERLSLDQSIRAIREGGILAALESQKPGNDNNWLNKLTRNQASPALRYQVQLMASHDFQEAVRNYQDLLTLQANLDDWTDSMTAYDEMLATRELRYKQHRPAAKHALQDGTLAGLRQRHANLLETITAVESENSPERLLNTAETAQWKRLQEIGRRLENLPDHEQLEELQDKHRLLKGVLYWQASASYRPRLWQSKQQLAELDELIAQSGDAVETLKQADNGIPAETSAFSQRITDKKASINKLVERSESTLARQGRGIEDLAVKQLEKQKQRLDTYLVQARFALAQTHDGALTLRTGIQQ
jgi:hypothetical protein